MLHAARQRPHGMLDAQPTRSPTARGAPVTSSSNPSPSAGDASDRFVTGDHRERDRQATVLEVDVGPAQPGRDDVDEPRYPVPLWECRPR